MVTAQVAPDLPDYDVNNAHVQEHTPRFFLVLEQIRGKLSSDINSIGLFKGKMLRLMLMMMFVLLPVSASQAFELKPYIGIGSGYFTLGYSEPGLKMDGPSWGMYVKGGVDFNKYSGAELRYGRTGEISTDFPAGTIGSARPFKIDFQADHFFSYLGKAQYPVNDRLKVYGLAGGTITSFRVKPGGTGLALSSRAVKTAFSYGLGGQYQFAPKGAIGLEWVAYSIDTVLGMNASRASRGSLSGLSVTIDKQY